MRVALIFAFCAGAAVAQEAPEVSGHPPPRPDPEDREETLPSAPVVVTEGVRAMLDETDADFDACLAGLDALGTVYTVGEAPVLEDDPDCGIQRPVMVEEIVPGVALRPDSRMRCATARALGEWVSTFVIPASVMLERGPVTGVDHGSIYICRRRNNASSGKLSEHSFGNAIDVMGFRFADGDAIAIEPREREGTMVEAFQDAVRATACLSFTTVLGPGTDASHADHLHLDVKERRGGFRLCQ